MLDSISYHWESEAFPDMAHHVESVRVHEALNEPYNAIYEVQLFELDVDLTTMLGKNALVTIDRAPLARRFCGIVCEVWEGLVTGGTTFARMRVVPAFWALGQRRNTRMFQKKTVVQILEDVLGLGLGEYGRAIDVDLSRTYKPREYCMQYQESDYDFCSRLMEEEGIHYSFDHEGDVELMLLRDTNDAFERAPSQEDPIELQTSNLVADEKEAVQSFERTHENTTTAVTSRDWDWTAGGDMVVEQESPGEDEHGRTRESYEHGRGRSLTITDYDVGARRYQSQDSGDQAPLRQERLIADGIIGRGGGRVIGFAPGTTFELTGHPTVGVDGEYLITKVDHQNSSFEAGSGEPYHNTFECIPLAVPYRPRRVAIKPRIDSIQTAIVTGPSGEEIHVDEHGRIKVQFHWDRENPADDTSSCWIRCEQDWSGPGWGFWWVPRIGMEVVVHFIDGDPDRPLVSGCVYNASNPTPYELPAEKTKSTIKSNSSPGGGGFNEFRFEDKAGSEEIYTHAQKDYDEVVDNDHNTLVHHDQTNEVDNDQTQTIHNNQTERVDVDQTMTVGGNRTVHVEGNFEETVDGTETRMVTGDVTENFDANETREVTGDVTEDISADETRTLGANQTEDIGGDHTQEITGASTVNIGGALTKTVTGGISNTTPAAHTMIATAGMSVTAAGGVKWVAPGGAKIIAPGGVTIIDGNNDWFGACILSTSVEDKNEIGLKIEIGGQVYGIAGSKVELHFISLAVNAKYEAKKGLFTDGETLNASTGARISTCGIQLWG